MSIKSFFSLNCEEAAGYCNKVEYREASFQDKIKLNLHLFFCSPCKKYDHNNHKLSRLIEKADLKSCTKEEKEAYRQRMKEESSETFK